MHPETTRPTSAIHDFDFLAGDWTTRQRRLKRRLQNDDEWESFVATASMQQLPGGVANFDTLVAEDWRPGWVGMSLRVFNPTTNLWSIHWFTNDGGGIEAATGALSTPVVGRFDGNEGVFEADDVHDGRPIRVRYTWLRRGADAARWQQAFSADGGCSWEVNWIMDFERLRSAPRAAIYWPGGDAGCGVVELRQYTLHAGRREELIDLFERAFIESQEAAGIAVMGQFRDIDDADRFTWLRGFADMGSRASALAAFYGGAVWQAHRDAANATMVDSDDVLLLRPAWPGAGIEPRNRTRAAGAVRIARPGLLDAGIFPLQAAASPELLQFCRDVMTPALVRGGAQVLGWYVTESAPNNFPRLPVREGGPVLVGLAMFDGLEAFDVFARSGAWARDVQPGLARWLSGPPQSRRLVATARSALQA